MITNNQKAAKVDVKETKGEIILDEIKCRGCNTCMLACSFHHASVFSRELSSIKVSLDYITGKVSWMISSNCDLCKGKKEFLCIKHCPYDCLSFKPF
ncbi:MAG: hypothetical protein HPY66_1835 [Firmicutes bacterium]|nr:hypothetical protein [Bacillota bacterium]